jgi:hypothetical protein
LSRGVTVSAVADRIIKISFKPSSEAQDQFIHTAAPTAAFVAGVGAGKTTALCLRAWLLSWRYPGNRGLLCRYSYDEVRDSLLPTWRKIIPQEAMVNPDVLDRKDLASQTLLVHSCDPTRPSEILFRNLEDPHKFESLEIGWFGISQANDPKITRRVWDTLCERLRWPVPHQFAFLEANYGGNASKGGWIWQIFVQEKAGELYEASTLDNWDNLPDDYKERLATLPEWRRKHSVYGSWDPLIDVRGIPVYPEFKYGFHVNEEWEPGDIRKRWVLERPVIRGLDIPGPGACVWVQMDSQGRILVLHELVFDHAIGISEFADTVQSESATYFAGAQFVDYVDTAAFRVEQTSGKSAAQILWEHGIRPRPAPQNISLRLQAVRDALGMAIQGGPGLMIDPSCYRLIGGFQGGYYLGQVGSVPGRYTPQPIKNEYSHVHDALQYAMTGIVRLQYSHSTELEELEFDTWLGRLRR